MKKLGLILLLLTLGFMACEESESQNENPVIVDPNFDNCIECKKIVSFTKAEADQFLADKLKEIQDLSTSVPCTDETKWLTTTIGAKACGGPTGYIAYSTTIDKNAFLKKVSEYSLAQAAYNKKFNVVSDCSVMLGPSKVICVDGKPKLVN